MSIAALDMGVAEPVIELVRPLRGFPAERFFRMTHLDNAGVLTQLISEITPTLKFLAVPVASFYPDYAPEIDDETVAELAITDPFQVLVLVIVRAGRSLAETTVNLRAPVLVNPVNGLAAQVILDDATLAVDAPLVP